MQLNTYLRFLFTAEYWKATNTVDGAGNVTTTLKYDRTIKCRLQPDGSGRTFMYTPDAGIVKGDHILNIKDSDGSALDAKEYAVTLAEPVINAFGHREYLRYWIMEA